MSDTLYINNTAPEPENINTIVFHKADKGELILSLEKGEESEDYLSLDLTINNSVDTILVDPDKLLSALLHAENLNWFEISPDNLELMANTLRKNSYDITNK
jgi:hypothetical protein